MQDDFNATATSGNISVYQPNGDLYVDSVTSTGGSVRVDLGGGTLVDANTNVTEDPRTWNQLLNVYTQMEATTNTAQESVDSTISAYESSQTSDYQSYWNFRNQEYSAGFVDGLSQGATYYVQVISPTQITLTTDAAGTSPVSMQAGISNGVNNVLYSASNTSNMLQFNSPDAGTSYSITGVTNSTVNKVTTSTLACSGNPNFYVGEEVVFSSTEKKGGETSTA